MVVVVLVCCFVGDGSVVPVEINTNSLVGILKKGIKAEKPNDLKDVDADKLHLFLAKTNDGAWLVSDSEDVKKMKKVEKTDAVEALTSEDKELEGEAVLQKVLAGMPKTSTDQVHVLVVLEKDKTPSPAAVLFEAILPQVLATASTTLTDRNRDFKDELYKFYGCYRRKKAWVRCILLDVAFPRSLMIASHLFRRATSIYPS